MPGTLMIMRSIMRSRSVPIMRSSGVRWCSARLSRGMSLPSLPARTLMMRGLSWLPIRFISEYRNGLG